LVVLLVAGCERGPKLVPAGGIVKYKGAPLPEANVVFMSDASSYPSLGRTDAQGRFTLSTAGKPGALPGAYRVAITAVKQLRPVAPGEAASMTTEQIEANHVKLIPAKYNNHHSSDLTADVAEDPKANEYVFDLR
jgi:hypothetical protein